MIISPKRRYIFVHIPKTGGTSMAFALEDCAAADDILIGDTPKAKRRRGRLAGIEAPGRLWKHSTLRDITGVVDPAAFFVFTLVRNPWDRIVSYYHWLRVQKFDHPVVAVAQSLDFTDFLRVPQVQVSLRNGSYSSYVTDAAGAEHCQLFARLEVPEDLALLWEHLGFKLIIPRLNASERALDWRAYYDAETFDIVSEITAEDIARFGYATQL